MEISITPVMLHQIAAVVWSPVYEFNTLKIINIFAIPIEFQNKYEKLRH